MDLSLLLENVGWSLDLTTEQNFMWLKPDLIHLLESPVPNMKEIVLYYPLTEQQDYFDRIRYAAPSITPRQILETISQYYHSLASARTFRASQRQCKVNVSVPPTKRDLLCDHTVLNRVIPSGDGYALYFS